MLKKMILTMGMFLFINTGIGFATPYNDMNQGESAAGVMYGSKYNTYYIENKFTDNVTAGFEANDWKGFKNTSDFYGQFKMNDNWRATVGARILDSSTRSFVGAIASTSITDECTGYASFLAGDGFQELQIGASYKITDNSDFNLNYRSLRYQGSRGGMNFGVTFKL